MISDRFWRNGNWRWKRDLGSPSEKKVSWKKNRFLRYGFRIDRRKDEVTRNVNVDGSGTAIHGGTDSLFNVIGNSLEAGRATDVFAGETS